MEKEKDIYEVLNKIRPALEVNGFDVYPIENAISGNVEKYFLNYSHSTKGDVFGCSVRADDYDEFVENFFYHYIHLPYCRVKEKEVFDAFFNAFFNALNSFTGTNFKSDGRFVLIEVQDNNITSPDYYDDFFSACTAMYNRYKNESESVDDDYCHIHFDMASVEGNCNTFVWRIIPV